MAEMGEGAGGGDHGKGKKRAKKSSTRVDMTPMVNLAFLLLTFFVMTSTFSKPKVMSLVYPAKVQDIRKESTPMNNGITFLLSEDKIFYYQGQYYSKADPGPKGATQLEQTDFSPNGIRKLLADLNYLVLSGKAELDAKFKAKKIDQDKYEKMLSVVRRNDDALKVLIKTDDKATTKNFIDLIDELKIAEISVIAPVDILASELELMKEKL